MVGEADIGYLTLDSVTVFLDDFFKLLAEEKLESQTIAGILLSVV